MSAEALTLIDTSAWILALRPDGSETARNEVARLLLAGDAATTGIVMLELLSGAKTQKEYRELHEDMTALVQLAISPQTWESACRFAYVLRRRGVTVPATDVLVMSVAVEGHCTLLHADRHFELMAREGIGLLPDALRSVL